MIVLGLETSCDETAAALVNGAGAILSQRLITQLDEHKLYGGVVPEIAARSHLDHLDSLIRKALADANCQMADLDGIAATCGPGLIGGVMVGTMMGKAMALALNKPFLAINHLEAHALTARLTNAISFPYLLLLVSGGHCQLLAVENVGRYKCYGQTIDDAVGEAFDKTAKLLGLGYPGGPAVEEAAARGNSSRFNLPQPMLGKPNCDFSFSGLKTAVRQLVQNQTHLNEQDKCDIAASFQHRVGRCLADRSARAMQAFCNDYGNHHNFVVAGGVAANLALRKTLEETAIANHMVCVVPPPQLCTDNAAMVAWAGVEKLRLGHVDSLDFAPRPRWPLTEILLSGTKDNHD